MLICLHSTIIVQFARFKSSRKLHHFNPKCALNFTAAAVLELTYADMYTDQFYSHTVHGTEKVQWTERGSTALVHRHVHRSVLLTYRARNRKGAVNRMWQYSSRLNNKVIKTQCRLWGNYQFKDWCKSRTRGYGFLIGANLFNIPSVRPSFLLSLKIKKKNLSNQPCYPRRR